MGLGTLIGTVVGALGGVGLAVAYNHKKGVKGTEVSWSTIALKNFAVDALILYLAVARFGRGRGDWIKNDYTYCSSERIRKTINEIETFKDIQRKQLSDILKKILKDLYPNSEF